MKDIISSVQFKGMDPTVASLSRAGLITGYGMVALGNRLWAELCKSHVKTLVLQELLLLP